VLTPTRYDGYLALEVGATHLANYQPMLVPGLLRTKGYVPAVISQIRKGLSPPHVEALVRGKLETCGSVPASTRKGYLPE
jgi:hypothetical protein